MPKNHTLYSLSIGILQYIGSAPPPLTASSETGNYVHMLLI